jgi:protein-S-isoprenylcysteine O-methyltransferase Ste14
VRVSYQGRVPVLLLVLHLLFWAPFVVRGRLDRATGAAPTGPAVAAAPAAKALVGLHSVGIGVMYFGAFWGSFASQPESFPLARVLGAAVIVGGTALSAWTLVVFRSWRLTAELTAGHQLCTEGPFRTVRHPIYTSLVLLALGTALLVTNTATLLAIPVVFVTGDVRARAEERLLKSTFGVRYSELMTRTARFVPGVY